MPKLKSERIGETCVMNNGIKATVISYKNESDIDILFENNTVARKVSYKNFKKGQVKCPLGYEVIGDYVKCTNYNITPSVVFLIDLNDLDRIKNFLWCDVTGYIYNPCKKYLHTYILGKNKGYEIDHINGNKTDNRRSNLRLCTRQENMRNRRNQKNSTTGYKGVYLLKTKNRYRARISINKQRIFIGDFRTPKQAAEAYNRAALLLHGEFARLNEIKEVA